MEDNTLKLFMFTVKEYKRFYRQLPEQDMLDTYDEKTYVEINTKLMILRKYGCKKENVYIADVIKKAIDKYHNDSKELKKLLEEYYEIEKQQFEYILSDGTKLNLYDTIEDVMYGIYLHADEVRINRLVNEKEEMRFICVRKYVVQLENIILKVYEILQKYEENIKQNEKQRAETIFLGDKENKKQEIVKSTYWSNLYGKDGNEDDFSDIIQDMNQEELLILLIGSAFIEELKKDTLSIKKLDGLIHSSTKRDWGDYSEAQKSYKSIEKPGLATEVKFNKEHTMAYIKILSRVDNVFLIDQPHIIDELYEISFAKENGEWKVYSMGGHVEGF